jgi:hypothetical protein
MKKQLIIELNVVTGEVEALNEDELTYFEIMGMLEYAKMMFLKDWLED